MDNTFLIYMHTAPNGKSYIGQTNNLPKRNHGHQYKTGCRAFYNAIQKYGWDNFEHRILAEGLTLDEANKAEAEFIATHNTLSPNGYNLRTGGNNSRHSDETKARQALAKIGKKHRPESLLKISAASKNQSAETREKQRLSKIGKTRSEETKAAIAASKIGKKRPPEVCAKISLGKQNISDETRRKMSESAKKRPVRTGWKMSAETKAKIRVTKIGKSPHNKGMKASDELKQKYRDAWVERKKKDSLGSLS